MPRGRLTFIFIFYHVELERLLPPVSSFPSHSFPGLSKELISRIYIVVLLIEFLRSDHEFPVKPGRVRVPTFSFLSILNGRVSIPQTHSAKRIP